jgi:hypothetical protein
MAFQVKTTFAGRSTCSLFYAPSTQLYAHSLPPIFPLVCMGSSGCIMYMHNNCSPVPSLKLPTHTAPAFGSAFGHTEASSSSNLAGEELLGMTVDNAGRAGCNLREVG